jgi:glycosidase
MNYRSLQEINFKQIQKRRYHPSPAAWEDQVLYFLMLDRFSDDREQGYRDNQGRTVVDGSTPMFQSQDTGNAYAGEGGIQRWWDAGSGWLGGSLKGLESKIGYLKRLGITAVWISPVFKQVNFQATYHGYGIQDFLTVDPHFGTAQDLRDLVRTAHRHGIFVILDIILNHTGNVFTYAADRYWTFNPGNGQHYLDPRWDGRPYQVQGFNNAAGQPDIPFGTVNLATHSDAWPNGAIWPAEFQNPAFYSQMGRIQNWDYDPEFLEADFFDLKDIDLGSGLVDEYKPSQALRALAQVYKYWIAFADIDGFRVDTVKHMDPGATRFFTSVIHEYAQTLGKENFYLIGEITGGRQRAFTTLEQTGLNAALGIDDIPDKLEYLVKGYRNPQDYFDLFRNSVLVQKESHVWFRNKVVTLFDDHDQVRKGGYKARFCAGDPKWGKMLSNVLALNVTSMGIPCIYYGSEQAFAGEGSDDRALRECMFGGEYGAFQSRERHFFNEASSGYQALAKILALRKQKIALRRGRQYLREISGNGIDFGLPRMIGGEIRSLVPWSRLFDDQELLLAFNTDPEHHRTAWVQVERSLRKPGDRLQRLYSSNLEDTPSELEVHWKSERPVVQLSVPAAGFVIYE